jgi:hypothetical protein
VFLSLPVLAFGVITAAAAVHTWTGKISDSTCGANYKKGSRARPDNDIRSRLHAGMREERS